MSALISLLARDQTVPIRKVEEALQRHVVSGGEVDTALLEIGAIAENVLNAYRAALYGLLPATRDEVMKASRETVRALPRALAEKFHAVPLRLEEGAIVLARTIPFTDEEHRSLKQMLSLEPIVRIATEVRVAAGLAHYYGTDMSPRIRRLAEKLRSVDAGTVPFVVPLDSASIPSSAMWEDPPTKPERGSMLPRSSGGPGIGVVPVVGVGSKIARRSSRPPPPRETFEDETTAPHISSIPAAQPAQSVVRDLAEAGDRDEILQLLFGFARRHFDYCALFIVQGDVAEGREAAGPGAGTDAVRRMAIPLDVPGVFAVVHKDTVPRRATLNVAELDRLVARDLRRPSDIQAIVWPVLVRSRVVLFIYGDRSGEPMQASDFPELDAVIRATGAAFERMLVEKKKSVATTPGTVNAPELAVPPRTSRTQSFENPVRGQRFQTPQPSALDLLGVPRSAPPPPAPPPAEEEHIDIGFESRSTGNYARVSPIPEPPAETNRPPAPSSASDRVRPPPPAPQSVSKPPVDGGYSVRSAGADVVRSVRPPRSGPPRSPSKPAPSKPAPSKPASSKPASRGPAAANTSRPPALESHKSPTERFDARREDQEQTPVAERVKVTANTSLPPDAQTSSSSPRKNTPLPNEPSIIIDLGGKVDDFVRELVESSPEEVAVLTSAVLQFGDAGLPMLADLFPGPVWFARTQVFRRLPHGHEVSGAAYGLIAFGEKAVPYVASILDGFDPDHRFYAVLVAAELPYAGLLDSLVARLKDVDPGVRDAVALALRRFRHLPEMPQATGKIRAIAASKENTSIRVVAIRALAELRDAESVRLLSELLGEEREVAAQAHDALVAITRQDFGDSRRKWETWYDENKKSHRIEWLIDSLMHSEEKLRAAAADELKHATQAYFGYHPQASKKERERAQTKYREWWKQEGRARFTAK